MVLCGGLDDNMALKGGWWQRVAHGYANGESINILEKLDWKRSKLVEIGVQPNEKEVNSSKFGL